MLPPASATIEAAGQARDEFRNIQRMLHLAHHRNRNQHRAARWWADFGVLRRQLGRLAVALEDLSPAAGPGPQGQKALKRTAKRTEEEEVAQMEKAARVEKRVLFLREVIIPKCWLAFSAVGVDTQYSGLGLMLIGTLARLDSLIAPMAPESKADCVVPAADLAADLSNKVQDPVSIDADLGEKILRMEVPEGGGATSDLQLTTEESKKKRKSGPGSMGGAVDMDIHTPTPVQTNKREKKRRKKEDVFDEIFSGLV